MPATVDALISTALSTVDIDVLTARIMRQIRAEEPSLTHDSPMADLLLRAIRDVLDDFIHVSDSEHSQHSASAHSTAHSPASIAAFARRAAQRDISLETLLRAYRFGHAAFHDEAIEALTRTTDDTTALGEAVTRLSAATFDFLDRDFVRITDTYRVERERWVRSSVAGRYSAVRAILSSDSAALEHTDTEIDYPFSSTHLSLIIWTDDTDPHRLTQLEHIVTALATRLGCPRPPLIAAPDDSTIWAWLPGPDASVDASAAASDLLDDNTWIAVSDLTERSEGFRLAHEQAAQARIVNLTAARQRRSSITRYRDIGVVGILAGDLAALRDWVHDTLGGLSEDTALTEDLRETYWAFLTTGGSFLSAAQQLSLHKNTVQLRVRKAQQLCGTGIRDAHPDVEIALLACRLLGASVLDAAPERAEIIA